MKAKTKSKDFTSITQKNNKYCDIRVFAKNGYSEDFDSVTRKKLESIAKKFGGLANGSGFCFLSKERDFGFAFPSREKASKFAKEAFDSNLIKSNVHICDVTLSWEYSDSMKVSYKKILN